MYLLDTDMVSLHQRGHPAMVQHLAAVPPHQVYVSTVTVAEQMRGCWNAVNKARNGAQLVAAYDLCHRIVDYYSQRNLLDFDTAAAQRFRQLRQAGIRIGTQDLRVAAVALEQGAVVVSRNTNDFNQVPDLNVEDWSV